MILFRIIIFLIILLNPIYTVFSQEKKGGIVLSFDDGYPSWIEIVAHELDRVGGKATAFVNNKRIKNGFITFEDLRILQNKYGWEIGTHTYNHFDAIEYVRKYGFEQWINKEVEASLSELTSNGLKIYSFVFPFNNFNDNLASEISRRFESYRKLERLPIAHGKRKDGSIPGYAIDIANYKPFEIIKNWIDLAHAQNKFVFLYGHEVLKDDEFFIGKITDFDENTLIADNKIIIKRKNDLCIVPDIYSSHKSYPIIITNIIENSIVIKNEYILRILKKNSDVIIGPCYATPISYFRKLIEYSAKKLNFYTVHEVITNKMIQTSN